jgi:hypothetical protein
MRFVKKKEVDVALKCQNCKNVKRYPLYVFPRSVYKRHGHIKQFCGCVGGKHGDGLGNTKHKIVGVFVERQVPVSNEEARKLLGTLVQ